MSKKETETTDLLKKKIKLNHKQLLLLQDAAHKNYVNLAPNPRMGAGAFTAYCWIQAVVDYLNRQGLNVEIKREK